MADKKPMTKNQLLSHLSEKLEMPKKSVGEFMDELVKVAVSETKKTGAFTLPGIGKLTLKKRKARKGRNPATGAEISIPAKTVVKMRLAKACQDAIVPPKKK